MDASQTRSPQAAGVSIAPKTFTAGLRTPAHGQRSTLLRDRQRKRPACWASRFLTARLMRTDQVKEPFSGKAAKHSGGAVKVMITKDLCPGATVAPKDLTARRSVIRQEPHQLQRYREGNAGSLLIQYPGTVRVDDPAAKHRSGVNTCPSTTGRPDRSRFVIGGAPYVRVHMCD